MFSVGTGSAVANTPASETGFKPPEVRRPVPAFSVRQRQTLILCLVLVAATLFFYNPISRDGFVLLDDVPYILSNPPVQAGLTWSTIKWSFTTFHAGYWHPLTWLSHALDCQLFGLNPAGHHYVSLLFHAANAVLLFLVLEEATALAWPSLIVAAIFAVHPVNVESVAWAAERKNVLSMFFFLLAMWAYGRYARRGGIGRYGAVLASFLLGMMAKPQIITLPFVLLLWDYWPLQRMFPGGGENPHFSQQQEKWGTRRGRSLKFLFIEKIPLFAIMLVGSILTVKAQRSADAVRTLGEFSLKGRLENAVVSYAKYLANLVWPRHLAPLYPHPGNSIPLWQVAVSGIVLLGLSAIALRWRERRYLAVGWLWFLGVLVPMIGLVQVGEQAMADRFVYIPMIGILIFLVWGAWEIAEKNAVSKYWIGVPAAIIVLVLGGITHRQLGYWKNGETLWRYALSVTQNNYMAHDNLAMVLDSEGRVGEAMPEFLKAEALHRYPLPQVLSMGVYLQRHGDLGDGMKLYQKVLSNAGDPQLRAMAWSQMAGANAQAKDYDQAKVDYQNALQLNPNNAGALVGSGLLAERNGDSARAVEQLSHAAKVEPSELTLLLLADVLDRAGRGPEARAAEQAAAKISSDMGRARRSVVDAEVFFGLTPLQVSGSGR